MTTSVVDLDVPVRGLGSFYKSITSQQYRVGSCSVECLPIECSQCEELAVTATDLHLTANGDLLFIGNIAL